MGKDAHKRAQGGRGSKVVDAALTAVPSKTGPIEWEAELAASDAALVGSLFVSAASSAEGNTEGKSKRTNETPGLALAGVVADDGVVVRRWANWDSDLDSVVGVSRSGAAGGSQGKSVTPSAPFAPRLAPGGAPPAALGGHKRKQGNRADAPGAGSSSASPSLRVSGVVLDKWEQ